VRSLGPTAGRVRRALRRYGVRGTARELYRAVVAYPARRRKWRADREFDRRYGVETAGIVRLHELGFESHNKMLGNRYEAVNPDWLRARLASLPVEVGEFTFLDVGAGKGRAMLLASEFGFRRIVGVEFSPELVEIARHNIERYRSPAQRCTRLELVCRDAALYEPPDEPLVVFNYNAFEDPVMAAVLANMRRSLEAAPRPALLVFADRTFPLDRLAEAGFRAVPDGYEEVFEYVPAGSSVWPLTSGL
jgi:SAM-dependent methyltransferase